MSGLNVKEIRKDFPILDRKIHSIPLVYLDNAATSQKPLAVLNVMDEYYRHHNANVHRGIHLLSEESTAAYEEAREKAANFINAPTSDEVIFTRGTTESINLVALTWGRKFIGKGDLILLTEMEHHSNLIPWQLLAKDVGARLEFIALNRDTCSIELDDLDRLLEQKPKLLAISHASNVLGNVNPVKEITRRAREHGVVVLIDGAQAVPHMPVDVQDIGCDFYAFSGHKMCGPTGIGVLHGRMERLAEMDPLFGGGEMILEVGLHDSTYKDPPWKFEAGTPNYIEAIGLGSAIDYLTTIGLKKIHEHEMELAAYAVERLEELGGVTVYGNNVGRAGIVSFGVDVVHPHDVAQILDAEGVAVRAGHHCAQPLMKWLNVNSTSRASFYLYNDRKEVDAFIDALCKAKEMFS